MLHGYFDHAPVCMATGEYCLRRGCSVLIWDLPGHGLSRPAKARQHPELAITSTCSGPCWSATRQCCRARFARHQPEHRCSGAARLGPPRARPDRLPVLPAGVAGAAGAPGRNGSRSALSYRLLRPFRRIRRVFMANSGVPSSSGFVQRDPQNRELPVRWVGAMRAWVHGSHPSADGLRARWSSRAMPTAPWTGPGTWPSPHPGAFPRCRAVIQGARHHLVNRDRRPARVRSSPGWGSERARSAAGGAGRAVAEHLRAVAERPPEMSASSTERGLSGRAVR